MHSKTKVMEERSCSRINASGELEIFQFETWVKVEGFNGHDPAIEMLEQMWGNSLHKSGLLNTIIYPITHKN